MDFENVKYALDGRVLAKVVGVGGGGTNAVQHMIDSGLSGVSFICVNTDIQALERSTAASKLQLGGEMIRMLGTGMNSFVGRKAALDRAARIMDALRDSVMVFVVACLGGGTGTGAAPVIAHIAKEELGALTVGVVTKPFSFEGANRKAVAESGIAEFRQHVDCLITISNDRLLSLAPKEASFAEIIKKANDVLYYAVKGIYDTIMENSLVAIDFVDVRMAFGGSGLASIGMGTASGTNRVREAAMQAITSPLLEDAPLYDANAVLYNITASKDITGNEIEGIHTIIADAAHPETNVFMGVTFDDNAGDALRVTLIAVKKRAD